MTKYILITIALLCLSCAGIEPAPQQISSKDFDTSGCDYLFDSFAELSAAMEAQAYEYESGHKGIVCHIDADNATFVQTEYLDGKAHGEQRTYGADGNMISSAYIRWGEAEYVTTYSTDGAELYLINLRDGTLPTGGKCGDGRELEPAEIIAWVRGTEPQCGAGRQAAYRNLSASHCQYSIYDVMLADGLVVTRAGGRTVDGRVCATQPYVYETYKYEYSFQGGILHGSTKTYSGDNLLSEVVYENGERVLQITYDDDEQIETPYADGKVEGIVKSYYNGKLNMESTYANGRLNGLNKGYCSNGTLCSETNYVNGVKEGSAKEYHSDGVLKRDYTYKNDKYEGYRKEFNEDGSLKGQILYQDGEPISGSCANGKPLTETELSIEWYYDYDEE